MIICTAWREEIDGSPCFSPQGRMVTVSGGSSRHSAAQLGLWWGCYIFHCEVYTWPHLLPSETVCTGPWCPLFSVRFKCRLSRAFNTYWVWCFTADGLWLHGVTSLSFSHVGSWLVYLRDAFIAALLRGWYIVLLRFAHKGGMCQLQVSQLFCLIDMSCSNIL